jgi:hypothetical protein
MNKKLSDNVEFSVEGNKSAGKVSGRQSNHGDFYLPKCLAHLTEPSFYMAVAWWGVLKKTPFTREDIAQAFRVTPRRAADVMTYLATAVSRDVVRLEKRVVRVGSGHSQLLMTVIAVAEPLPARPAGSAVAPRAHPRKRAERTRDLLDARDLFLGRRPRVAD